MRALFLFGLGAMLALPALPASAFNLSDARHIVSISSPVLSPDGSRLAYIRGAQNFDDDRTDRSIILLDVASRATRTLVSTRKHLSAVAWSPDGRNIFFIAQDETMKDPQDEVFELSLDGGDARAITSAPNGVDSYDISHDGRRIAYETADDNPNKKEIDAHLDAFEVGSNDYLRKEAQMNAHIWVQTIGEKSAHRLSSGTYSTSGAQWTADDRSILFQWLPTPYVGDSLASQARLVDVASHAVRLLDGKRTEDAGQPAPRGSAVAYARPTGSDSTNGVDLYVVDARGRVVTDFRTSVDRNVDAYAWNSDASGLYVATPDKTQLALWYQPIGGKARRLPLGALQAQGGLSTARNGTVAFIGAPSDRPGEVYLWNGSRALALTNENAFAAHVAVAKTIGVTWHSTKGDFDECGVLTYPLHFNGRKAPMVLLIHGGPQGASTVGWSTLRQEIASRGYFVFEPNYRGGTDSGDRYQRAIANDNGDGPGKDVMAGVAKVESSFPIDTSRVAVSGWSYGGFMTSWLIGNYHVWKAAVSGASLDDWFDDFNLAFYVYTDVPFFHGVPGDPRYRQEWIDQSPITYAPHITTPTLIMGDVGDDNVVITNSYRLYHAIKDNGTPVEFVAYPVPGHHPSDPVRSEDVNRRWIGWLDKYLK